MLWILGMGFASCIPGHSSSEEFLLSYFIILHRHLFLKAHQFAGRHLVTIHLLPSAALQEGHEDRGGGRKGGGGGFLRLACYIGCMEFTHA